MDRKPSQPPRELGHRRRCIQPATWRFLVGPPAVALPVGSLEHEKVVPGPDTDAVHHLGQGTDSARCHLALFWLLPVWLGRIFLAWRYPPALLPAHAMLCQQPPPPEARL